MISFTVPGNPVPQGRPRFARHGRFVHAYDPATSTDFKSRVAVFARQAGVTPISGPLIITVVFYRQRPKKLMGKKYPDGAVPCDKRPDLDNFLKAVLDGLNGIAFRDDGQVFRAVCQKMYHEKTGMQRTEIRIEVESDAD